MIEDKILSMLNNDHEARRMHQDMIEIAQQTNASKEQIEAAERIIVLMRIKDNPEIFKTFSDHLWDNMTNMEGKI